MAPHNKSSFKNWNDEETEYLISEIQKFPCIYDSGNKLYKNQNAKQQAREEIAASLNCDAKDVAAKWDYLKDKFCRQRNLLAQKERAEKSGASADDIPFVREWIHYERLSFLQGFMKV